MGRMTILVAVVVVSLLSGGCAALTGADASPEPPPGQSAPGAKYAEKGCREEIRKKVEEFALGKCPRGDKARIEGFERQQLNDCMRRQGYERRSGGWVDSK